MRPGYYIRFDRILFLPQDSEQLVKCACRMMKWTPSPESGDVQKAQNKCRGLFPVHVSVGLQPSSVSGAFSSVGYSDGWSGLRWRYTLPVIPLLNVLLINFPTQALFLSSLLSHSAFSRSIVAQPKPIAVGVGLGAPSNVRSASPKPHIPQQNFNKAL